MLLHICVQRLKVVAVWVDILITIVFDLKKTRFGKKVCSEKAASKKELLQE